MMVAAKPLRVLIVDDEPIACSLLEWLLQGDKEIEILGSCSNGKEAFQAIREKRPDLVFLDVQMPGLNGFDLLRALPENEKPHLIFVTAFDKYAIQAFEVQAMDYLLKPFTPARFQRALDRAKEQIIGQKQLASLHNYGVRGTEYLHRLELKYSGRIYFLPVEQIAWIGAADQYVDVHSGKKSYLIRFSMESLEKKLHPAHFVRIHRSAIVNVNFVKVAILNQEERRSLILKDETELPVSRRRASLLRKSTLPAFRIR